jgi:hypothetical protein
MTTRIKKEHIQWLVMRYPEHANMFQHVFTLAELVERFFDSTSGLNIIAKAFCPDEEDIEQIDKALLLRLWWLSDVEQSAVEIIVNWLGEYRNGVEH